MHNCSKRISWLRWEYSPPPHTPLLGAWNLALLVLLLLLLMMMMLLILMLLMLTHLSGASAESAHW